VNWFSAPWIYKEYVDEVFSVGLTTKALLEGDGRTVDLDACGFRNQMAPKPSTFSATVARNRALEATGQIHKAFSLWADERLLRQLKRSPAKQRFQ
jgi:putative NADPH-quinone reductase